MFIDIMEKGRRCRVNILTICSMTEDVQCPGHTVIMLHQGVSQTLLAEQYEVLKQTINKIKTGRSWSHL